jgi:hypothetical protein
MDTEGDDEAATRRIHFLMQMLTNLNAGAMFALCIWLAWAAMDYSVQQAETTSSISIDSCGCTLSEVTNWSGRIDIAVRDQ